MAEKKITGEVERFSYALGMNIASNLIRSGIKTINPEAFVQAINDTFVGNIPEIMPDEANSIIEKFMKDKSAAEAEQNLKEGREFLAGNKQNEGVNELPSGLQYIVLKEGSGEKPALNDQ